MAFTTYAVLPGQLGKPSGPVQMKPAAPCQITLINNPMVVMPVRPMFVVNGNGVTLVQGSDAAGSRPTHGQQWSRGAHVVLSQFASRYAGVGQR